MKFLYSMHVQANSIDFHLQVWTGVEVCECYKLKTFRVGQKKEPYIEFMQENLIENSVQDSLPYILNLHGLC